MGVSGEAAERQGSLRWTGTVLSLSTTRQCLKPLGSMALSKE